MESCKTAGCRKPADDFIDRSGHQYTTGYCVVCEGERRRKVCKEPGCIHPAAVYQRLNRPYIHGLCEDCLSRKGMIAGKRRGLARARMEQQLGRKLTWGEGVAFKRVDGKVVPYHLVLCRDEQCPCVKGEL